MNAQIRTLKADIAADLQVIAEIYASLNRYPETLADQERVIAVAYYLHNLYCAFESTFQRVSEVFENQIPDRNACHAGLLHQMTLDIEGIRPRLISPVAFDSLDELRRFRHLFRSAYRLHLDHERLALVRRRARALEAVYRADMDRFLAFLDSLLQLGRAETCWMPSTAIWSPSFPVSSGSATPPHRVRHLHVAGAGLGADHPCGTERGRVCGLAARARRYERVLPRGRQTNAGTGRGAASDGETRRGGETVTRREGDQDR